MTEEQIDCINGMVFALFVVAAFVIGLVLVTWRRR